MPVDLYTLKFVPDLRRREPRNVGVIAVNRQGPGLSAQRFLELAANGRLVGPSPVPSEVYEGWVDYYVTRAAEGRWEDVDRLRRSREVNFYLERVSTVFDEEDPAVVVDRMFPELVTQGSQAKSRNSSKLAQVVDELFRTLQVTPERNRQYEGRLQGEAVPVDFDYSYTNSQVHLMDLLPLGRANRRRNAMAFAMKTTLAKQADLSESFVAFADLSPLTPRDVDDDLRVVEKTAELIDVSRWHEALDHLGELVSHH